ncbi:MAG: DNA repair protein RecO [Holosporales bacterium]|jgi:DNA repair protein RecO|nr:DNA repair protein RecO [Holosporales bacterium]
MISWSDTGIVISVRNGWKAHSIVSIFTENHGSIPAICNHRNPISPFSNVCLDWRGKNETDLGFWRINDVRQNWVHCADFQLHVNVCREICLLLNETLPTGIPHPALFHLVHHIANDLHSLSKIEALKTYAYFEFLLLKVTGFGFDLRTCGVCNRCEPIEFISSKTGYGISNKCATNTTDQMFRIPRIWKEWEAHTLDQNEINQSLTITNFFIRKHLLYPHFIRPLFESR